MTGAPCPVCGKAPDPRQRPFCSRACRDRDLVAWLSDGYRLPGSEEGDGVDSLDEPD